MRVNRGLLGWGLFFIVLGGVAIGVRQGLIADEDAARAWTLWPLILVFAGVAILTRRTPVAPLADLAVAATFGLIVGGIVSTGAVPMAGCGDARGSTAFPAQSGELGAQAEVDLELLCGDLTVRAAAGAGWTIEGSDDRGRGPEVDVRPDRLRVQSPSGVSIARPRDSWTVALPTDARLDLEAQVNAGTARLELRGARLGRLQVGINAGEATIDLSGVEEIGQLEAQFNAVGGTRIVLPARSMTGSIEANAASIRICAPSGVGLRLTADDSVASAHNYADRGLVRSGNAWQTSGYDSATARIDLRTQVNAGNFELEPEGACDA